MPCVFSSQVQPGATGARNHSQCDSMLIGDEGGANTYPYIQVSSGATLLGANFSLFEINFRAISKFCRNAIGYL